MDETKKLNSFVGKDGTRFSLYQDLVTGKYWLVSTWQGKQAVIEYSPTEWECLLQEEYMVC